MAFIVPDLAPAPLYEDALENLFHDTIQGILGIVDGSLVRPRWQVEPPNQPEGSVDWVAFGIVSNKGDWQPWKEVDPLGNAGAGTNIFERDEELILLNSFYGPHCMSMQSQWQDGLQYSENRQLLYDNGIKFKEVLEAYQIPALLKQHWVKKMDQRAIFRRRIRRVFSIHYLLTANIDLDNEQYHTQITVTQ